MRPSNFPLKDTYDSQDGIAALNDLIHSAGEIPDAQQEMLQLVSAILAGYCAQACSEYFTADYVPPKDRRAPIISVNYSDYAYLILEQIVEPLAVDTADIDDSRIYAFSGRPLKAKYCPLLPHRSRDRSITDGAYLKLPGLSCTAMPQYWDTMMLVHCRFFPGSKLAELQRLTPWVSLVLYDAPSRKLLSAPIHITKYVLAASSGFWDREKLRFVVERYANRVSRKSRQKQWKKRIERSTPHGNRLGRKKSV